MSRRQFILSLGLHTAEDMATNGFEAYWTENLREITSKADLRDYWSRIAFDGGFLSTVPSYTYIRDPLRRLCHRLIAFNISGRCQAPKNVTATDLFYLRSMDEGTLKYGVLPSSGYSVLDLVSFVVFADYHVPGDGDEERDLLRDGLEYGNDCADNEDPDSDDDDDDNSNDDGDEYSDDGGVEDPDNKPDENDGGPSIH
ncbi:hypothetical protein Tco_0709730 [Tanacetum coccineum]